MSPREILKQVRAATRLALDYFKASRSHLTLYPDT